MAVRWLLISALILGTLAALSHYEVLGVDQDADEKQIKRAYRVAALKWHPDKNKPEDKELCEARFTEIAEAYSVLSDPAKRRKYDAGGGQSGGHGFGFEEATELFRENFGEELWKKWQSGDTVTGTLVRDGKRIRIKIFPDGTSEEQEDDVRGTGSYTYTSSRHGTQLQIEGGLGTVLPDMLLPAWVQDLPVIGGVLVFLISWIPTVCCCGGMWWCCCSGGKRTRAKQQ